MDFVDEAALSPPDGYKDSGLKNAFSGALSGHVFGAQHMQQLQVIQRLQQQRAAMLAARVSSIPHQQSGTTVLNESDTSVCTECAECVECASKQYQEKDDDVKCESDVAHLNISHVSLVPMNNSPERKKTQKEIIAGEERPKFVVTPQLQESQDKRIRREVLHNEESEQPSNENSTTEIPNESEHYTRDVCKIDNRSDKCLLSKSDSVSEQITGILKGGKLWKNEGLQGEEASTSLAEEDANFKRSVRFQTENSGVGKCESNTDTNENSSELIKNANTTENKQNTFIVFKKHSSIFHNALRPNSAVRQLFPSSVSTSTAASPLTHEALKAFDESKRGTLVSNILSCSSDSNIMRRTIERNALRRSLIKYDFKKKPVKPDITLEERIKQLTCDIDESNDQYFLQNVEENNSQYETKDHNFSEEENSNHKFIPDKSFSPSSSASSSSSGSNSAYKKISDLLNKDRRQEKITEAEENPIVIIPQECRCPAAPDLGMGVQVPAAHTQIHQTPPRQQETRRQFLSTLAPLTACVAGQKDDFSYYTLATGDRNSTVNAPCSEYSVEKNVSVVYTDETRKVAPDVIAGTPGQEHDELVAFAQQESNRIDKVRKRYGSDNEGLSSLLNANSDDDEQNDYGFNKRPSVCGIKSTINSNNEILQEMREHLAQPNNSQCLEPTYVSARNAVSNNVPQIQQHQKHQIERTWKFYTDTHTGEQRVVGVNEQLQEQASTNFYQALPTALRHTFQGHEESLMYQNCHSIALEHYGGYSRSPTRRPESPPPLKNYHQTMVLIPYNADTYAQFSTINNQHTAHQIRRHNVVEYQQVTQQTIRVPIGYALPSMQLHVVAGRGNAQPSGNPVATHQISQYAEQNQQVVAPRSFNLQQDIHSLKYSDKHISENVCVVSESGSTTTQPTSTDTKTTKSSTLNSGTNNSGQNCSQQTSGVNTGLPGAVFYAMNV